jgi:adenosylmethionine-8-amino-7-oxononanoate aminotransferase
VKPLLWRPYTQMKAAAPPLEVASTEGCRIRLADGRELVDGIASWWTACHGYNHPHIVRAIDEQLHRMPHVMFGGLTHEPATRLAKRLAALTGLDHVFFCDSGSVAVEVALKMAAQYWINRGAPRARFVCFDNAYHGDTMGAMSVSDANAGMHRRLAKYLPEQIRVPLTHRNFRGAAAAIVEPLVQCAGGMKVHSPETLAAIAKACARDDTLLILDEIATGFGRTGTMFACEQAGVMPDIMCVGKALTGGAVGLAAVLASARVFDAFWSDDAEDALMHGPTYMANPLACAAANASLDLFESEPRLGQVAAVEAHLKDALAPCLKMPNVVDVRVKGALGALQMPELTHLQWMKDRFIEEGVWLRPFGDVVYCMPPLTISDKELAQVTGAMVRVVQEAHGRN